MNENNYTEKIKEVLKKKNKIFEDTLSDIKKTSNEALDLSDSRESSLNQVQNIHHGREELENERRNQLNRDLEAKRELRQKLSWATFIFMCVHILIILGIVIFCKTKYDTPEMINSYSAILRPLIYTSIASMALFGWILKGLFPKER